MRHYRQRAQGFILITVIFIMLIMWVYFMSIYYFFHHFFNIKNQEIAKAKANLGMHNAIVHMKMVMNQDKNRYDLYSEGVYSEFIQKNSQFNQGHLKHYSYGEGGYYIYLKDTSSSVCVGASTIQNNSGGTVGFPGEANHITGDIELANFFNGLTSVWTHPILSVRSLLSRDVSLRQTSQYQENITQISRDLSLFSYGLNHFENVKKLNLRDPKEVNDTEAYLKIIHLVQNKGAKLIKKILCIKDHFDSDFIESRYVYKGSEIKGYESTLRLSECGWSQEKVSDPQVFFIELKNEQKQKINLRGWKLDIGGIEVSLPNQSVAAQDFIILTNDLKGYKKYFGYNADIQLIEISGIKNSQYIQTVPTGGYTADKMSWLKVLKNGIFVEKKYLNQEETTTHSHLTYKTLSSQAKEIPISQNSTASTQEIIGELSNVYSGQSNLRLQVKPSQYKQQNLLLFAIFECRSLGQDHILKGINKGANHWRIPGMININTASLGVLKSLPISNFVADSLYNKRYDQKKLGWYCQSAVDFVKFIYQDKGLTLIEKKETVESLLPLICYESQVFYFDILSRHQKGQKVRVVGYIHRGWEYRDQTFNCKGAQIISKKEIVGFN